MLDFCRRSCWRACRSGWFSIFWINSRTLVLCACFTTECGNPGIRKSMFTSFSIVCSWLKLSWSTTGLPVLSRSVLSPECCAFMTRTCLRTILCLFQQRVSSFFHVPLQRWDPYCLQMNVLGLHSFQQRVSPLWRNSFFVKRINIDLLRTGRFLPSCTVLVSSLTTGLSVLSRHGLRIGCPILFSIRVSRISLVEAEVTCILFRIWLLQVPS